MFRLLIDTDHEAFLENPHPEIARLLHEAAESVTEGYDKGPLKDLKGLTVGIFELIHPVPEEDDREQTV
jgi:hypothetical protein